MGYGFNFDKFKKHSPGDIRDLISDEYDYEYADEFDYMFDDEFDEEESDEYDM